MARVSSRINIKKISVLILIFSCCCAVCEMRIQVALPVRDSSPNQQLCVGKNCNKNVHVSEISIPPKNGEFKEDYYHTPNPYNVTITEINYIGSDIETHSDGSRWKNVIFDVRGYGLIASEIRIRLIPGTSIIKDRFCCFNQTSESTPNKYFNGSDIGKFNRTGAIRYKALMPNNITMEKLFLCVSIPNQVSNRNNGSAQQNDVWFLQEPSLVLNPDESKARKKRKIQYESGQDVTDTMTRNVPTSDNNSDLNEPRVKGLRMEVAHKEVEFDEQGIPDVLADTEHVIRLFGYDFFDDMIVTFTGENLSRGRHCQYPISRGFSILNDTFKSNTVRVKIILPPMKDDITTYYICIKNGSSPMSNFIHQGNDKWLQIRTYENLLPLWLSIMVVVVCLMFSALFSGLNLGLMSLDRTELKILCNTGTASEQKHANVIQPVRDHGNYLLCSILLGNVFVNSIFTIFLDSLTSGLIAVLFSTIAIVLFGEITPQAICSRHGLAVGAKTIYITKFVMLVTFPLSYPVSKILDCLLGEEIGNVYNRERLKELVKVTTGENDLDKDEVNIISGALELRKKTVSEVMTKIDDVFMLDYESILDFATVNEIMKSGYSRVPVYESNRQNIVTMLYIKDLAFVDPDDNTPLKTLCQFYQNPCNFVFEDVTLDYMFKIFKEGNKGHMAFVQRVNSEGEGDPFYETVGLITLEDVIEELIQAEIMDETDVFTDNRTKRRRNAERRQDFSVFAERRGEGNRIHISPQLTLAAFQFLSTSVEQFLPAVISETILKRLLKQDIVYHIRKNKGWRTDSQNIIYQQGKNADYFVIVLEGRVEVTVGKENLLFEGGPFSYFGTQALVQTIGISESPSVPTATIGSLDSLNLDAMVRYSFQPDYTVRACSEVIYLRIKRALYLAAKRATLMERSQKEGAPQINEQFDEEVDKILHCLGDEDIESGHASPTRKQSTSKPGPSGSTNAPSTSSTNEYERGIQRHQDSPSISHASSNNNHKNSLYSNASPPHRFLGSRDVNGSIRKRNPVDELTESLYTLKDEEYSLLTQKT